MKHDFVPLCVLEQFVQLRWPDHRQARNKPVLPCRIELDLQMLTALQCVVICQNLNRIGVVVSSVNEQSLIS